MEGIITILLTVTLCYISFALSFRKRKIKTKTVSIPIPKYNTSNFKEEADKFFDRMGDINEQ